LTQKPRPQKKPLSSGFFCGPCGQQLKWSTRWIDLTSYPRLIDLENSFDITYAVKMLSVVIDTNVFVAGLRSGGGASRSVLRKALQGALQPLFGNALWMEYQDLLDRPVWGDFTSPDERRSVLSALAKQARWISVYYGWRPNLPDEGDNHLIELALAGGAQAIVTHNLRDLMGGQLRLGKLRVLTPAQCLEELK
jgi:putative PIN family toxin of toxin-antitoxin system